MVTQDTLRYIGNSPGKSPFTLAISQYQRDFAVVTWTLSQFRREVRATALGAGLVQTAMAVSQSQRDFAVATRTLSQFRREVWATALGPRLAQTAMAISQSQRQFSSVGRTLDQFRGEVRATALDIGLVQAAMTGSQYRREFSTAARTLDQFRREVRATALDVGRVQVAMTDSQYRREFSTAARTLDQFRTKIRATELDLGRVQTALESIDSPTSCTSSDARRSVKRPADATSVKYTAPYSVRPIPKPKRTPRKTAPGPIARLRNLGNPIAASYCEDALALLELGFYRNSAHSSICAIESVIKEFNPNKDFGKVIDQMRADGAIHPAFAEAIKKLWGYCSNRPGMRHADYPSSPFHTVSAKDARMLYGVCAFIAEYLADTQD